MVITKANLLRAVPELYKPAADEFVASFGMWAVHFGIDTYKRAAMYLAEVFHESGNLRYTEENMNYSAEGLMKTWPSRFTKEKAQEYARKPEKIANYVYANRMGNGNEASGDGWRFRGRAFIGITGKYNYQKYANSEWCVGDLMANPDMLSRFPENQKASMWFWLTHDLNKYADICDIDKCSRIINGGTLGMANRKFLYRRFCKEFGIIAV